MGVWPSITVFTDWHNDDKDWCWPLQASHRNHVISSLQLPCSDLVFPLQRKWEHRTVRGPTQSHDSKSEWPWLITFVPFWLNTHVNFLNIVGSCVKLERLFPSSVVVQTVAYSPSEAGVGLGRGILKRHQVLLTIFEIHWSGCYSAYAIYFTLRLIVVDWVLRPDYSGCLSEYVHAQVLHS